MSDAGRRRDPERMNWLITGGCGFIGGNLVAKLASNPACAVRVFDDLSSGSREELAENTAYAEGLRPFEAGRVHLVVGSILDVESLEAASEGADVVVHLAANSGVQPSVEDPRGDCLTNVVGTLNALEAARHSGARRFVFASSGAPIGECTPPIHEEKAAHPVSPYGASKLAGEGYCSCYFRTFGVETVALRFGNVYGPGSRRKSSVIAKFIRMALAGETAEVYGDGLQTRDFIYIGDLVEAIVRAADAPDVAGEIFQIATSRESTVQEIVDELQKVFRSRGLAPLEHVFGAERLGDVRRNYSDTTKARERLGWCARTSLKRGIEQTVDWFLAASPVEQ